jgi:hypothetical protein
MPCKARRALEANVTVLCEFVPPCLLLLASDGNLYVLVCQACIVNFKQNNGVLKYDKSYLLIRRLSYAKS